MSVLLPVLNFVLRLSRGSFRVVLRISRIARGRLFCGSVLGLAWLECVLFLFLFLALVVVPREVRGSRQTASLLSTCLLSFCCFIEFWVIGNRERSTTGER